MGGRMDWILLGSFLLYGQFEMTIYRIICMSQRHRKSPLDSNSFYLLEENSKQQLITRTFHGIN